MHIELKSKRKYKGVSWIWMLILIGITSTVIAAVSNAPEKEYIYKATLTKYIKGDKWTNIAKQALLKSDLPSRDVATIIDSLTEFQNSIITQINQQLDAEKKLSEKPTPKTDSENRHDPKEN